MHRTHPLTLLIALAGTVLIQVCHADPFTNANDSTVAYTRSDIPAAMRCKDLVATSDHQYTIIAAAEVKYGTVPAHCRVTGLVPSEVRFELNLPTQWNGRLYMFGNGGLAGTPAIDPAKQQARDQALAHGFATIYTDTGHDRRVEPGGTFAYNNLHKLIDYGFRAVHLSVTTAKSIATTFYNKPPKYSYWNGCSTGGRQAMIAAQRFPQDFDGIIAGAPAADYSGLKFSQAARVAAISRSGLEEAEVLALAGHIYAKCDALDGAADGLIDDPRRCRFDIDSDLPKCKGKDTDSCFDQRELAALKKYYAPVMLGDQQVYPAMPVGSEVAGHSDDGTGRTGWYPWLINSDGPVLLDLLGSDFFRYMVFVQDRPDFDWTQFDFAKAPDNLDEFRMIVDATDPDLSAFKARGGKLLSYFGWADPDINPLTLIDYRTEVALLDAQVDEYFRVFMIPGMFHCRGGAGPDRFDAMTPLIEWVEADRGPEQLELWRQSDTGSSTGKADRSLACPYPQAIDRRSDSPRCRVPGDMVQ